MISSEICNRYIDGLSIKQISKICGHSCAKVRKILMDGKVNLRPKYTFNRSQISNARELDVDYFKEIDSSDKAYWLGIISSDGTISRDGYKVSLTSKDFELVENFKKSIKSSHKISIVNSLDKRTNKIYKRYLIQIASKDFAEDIISNGVTSNKSHISFFPKIKKIFYNDFIRGIFDGDGSLERSGQNSIRISFTGSKEILEYTQEYFKSKYSIEKHPIYQVTKNMNVYRTHYFKDSDCILDILYKNSSLTTRLTRKYKIYNEYKNRKFKTFDEDLINRIIVKFKNGDTIKKISEDEKMTIMLVSRILHDSSIRKSKRFKNIKGYAFFDGR